ncbi:sigma factor-binding protein Crl [Thaumasiovibrio subtropicus]|uniref:sigma factor-binding protein Crl n=1 Tax=Thaumasiovibrio subtropicus TaxID=1891207 RepID=UPI000B3636ED|nr:sigma factor-binding protein Crl [Thaumasiovibrio subtropicus]
MTTPTHGRLMIKLAAIGPYLRDKRSQKERYFFDSLVSCVNAKKPPEEREFWGWWLILDTKDENFVAQYGFGRYDLSGDWQSDPLPKNVVEEVEANLAEFEKLLSAGMLEHFNIQMPKATEADENRLQELAISS